MGNGHDTEFLSKTVGESGRAVVTLSSPSLGEVKIDFEIEK
jgi:hypothetical protein